MQDVNGTAGKACLFSIKLFDETFRGLIFSCITAIQDHELHPP